MGIQGKEIVYKIWFLQFWGQPWSSNWLNFEKPLSDFLKNVGF